ncbi:uncharacterized protein LOC107641229 [Arachis ipaensis]|uniref:uncharacterized protein LOC107641229 n=1 Tax=Arachis ipaensis TaxID=130454 RepID=UPI000A2B488E|nr:uncharacterized protein LOC107641229 [Arachis ipaensis]
MASEESFVVLVHHRETIKRKTRSGVKFTDKDPLSIFVRPTTSYDDLGNSVIQKLGLQGVKRVKNFFYRIPISVLKEIVKPAGASSSVPVYEPPVQPVASHSFAVDLNYSGGGEVGQGGFVPSSLQCVAPVGLGDALLDDPDDDDVESDIIADDIGDDIGASEPAGMGRGSSSGTQQYPPHFFSLDLDAMRQDGVPGEPARFGARDAEGSAGLTEFSVGQQFQDKDEVVLSVKTYSIRRGVQYTVVESDYRRLQQRKGIWEVKRYNGPHTCLATSISSDHRSLDYHVISAFIMPMVRADASVSIKVHKPLA